MFSTRYEQQKEELFHRIHELEQRLSGSRSECEALRIECEEIRSANANATATLERAREDGESSEKFLKRQLRLLFYQLIFVELQIKVFSPKSFFHFFFSFSASIFLFISFSVTQPIFV